MRLVLPKEKALSSLLNCRVWEGSRVWVMQYGGKQSSILVRLNPANYGRKRRVFGKVMTRKCIESPEFVLDTLIGNGSELLDWSQCQASAY